MRDREDAIAALAIRSRWIDGEARRRSPRVRLVEPAPEAVDAQWWPQLGAAIAVLAPEVGVSTTQDAVMAALEDALQLLGVRAAEDGDEVVVAPEGFTDAASWLLATVARLWESGAAIDWPMLHGGAGRRVELPTYPFQRRRYWVEARPEAAASEPTGRAADPSQWTNLPVWDPFPVPTADLDERLRLAGPWLVLSDDERAEALIERLGRAGAEVIAVRPGPAFDQDDMGDFFLARLDDFTELFESMLVAPRTIVHGFSLASRCRRHGCRRRPGHHVQRRPGARVSQRPGSRAASGRRHGLGAAVGPRAAHVRDDDRRGRRPAAP